MNSTNHQYITKYFTANDQPILKSPASEEELKNLTGIVYLFFNKINHKVYVGQYKHSFYKRYSKKRENWYKYAKNPHFKYALKLFFAENFEIFILEHSINNLTALDLMEITYIDMYYSCNNKFGYNKTIGGNRTTLFCDEIKNKLKIKRESRKEIFVHKAKIIHENKFDYSNIVFNGMTYKVENILCNKCHKTFNQLATCHVQGQGCPECGRNRRRIAQRMTKEEFIEKAIIKHGNEFDYCLDNFINIKSFIKVKHKNCGYEFYVTVSNHLYKNIKTNACPKCRKGNMVTSGKGIVKVDPINNTVVEKFVSIAKAEKSMGCSHMTDALKSGKILKGFIWKYSDGFCYKKRKVARKLKNIFEKFIKRSIEKYGDERFEYDVSSYSGLHYPVNIFCNICCKWFSRIARQHLKCIERYCPNCKNVKNKILFSP